MEHGRLYACLAAASETIPFRRTDRDRAGAIPAPATPRRLRYVARASCAATSPLVHRLYLHNQNQDLVRLSMLRSLSRIVFPVSKKFGIGSEQRRGRHSIQPISRDARSLWGPRMGRPCVLGKDGPARRRQEAVETTK